MQNSKYLCVLSLIVLVGCGPQNLVSGLVSSKDWDKQSETAKKADAILADMKATNICNQTGGEIAVEGAAVSAADNKKTLDQRIKIEMENTSVLLKLADVGTAGFMGEQDKKVIKELSENKQGTYINLGCEKLDQQTLESLREEKINLKGNLASSNTETVRATKIFMCGNGKLNFVRGGVAFFASEIHMKNMDFYNVSEAAQVAFIADKLNIEGKNSIVITSPKQKVQVQTQTSWLKLYVGKEVKGNGTLTLDSRAGNCVYAPLVQGTQKR